MSFAAFKMMHWATGIEHCASGFITHSSADSTPKIPPITADDIDSDWTTSSKPIGPVPNLITAAANVLEVYTVRIQEEASPSLAHKAAAEPKGGGAVLAGISGASLELVCHYRLHCIFDGSQEMPRSGFTTELDMKHVKDFIFIHGYIEPVVVILHEHELTWVGRVAWKHHTCMVSALSVNTTLKQHPAHMVSNESPS